MGSLIASLWAIVAAGKSPATGCGCVCFLWMEGRDTRWELWRMDTPHPRAAEGIATGEPDAAAQMGDAHRRLGVRGLALVVRERAPEVAHG